MNFQDARSELDRRHPAMQRIIELRQSTSQDIGLSEQQRSMTLADIHRVCILASSSRGGTSATAELLQWQGSDSVSSKDKILSLPGEERPHMALSGLAFPGRDAGYDDLNRADATEENMSRLGEDMLSEIGYPVSHCRDMNMYATQLYRRLLLQWPKDLSSIDSKDAIGRLTSALHSKFPEGYEDTPPNREAVLFTCVQSFPFIHPAFYSCSTESFQEAPASAGMLWSIEETPFVLPPPWHNATPEELREGILLLRDPSNAWRLEFWNAVFPTQQKNVLHLIRDARESMQGLCDGWNYPLGFQTMMRSKPLSVRGYTDTDDSLWRKHRLNFSVPQNLSERLDQQALSLPEIVAHQWNDAHQRILTDADSLSLSRTAVRFDNIRANTPETFEKICGALGIEASVSGLAHARHFPERWIMTTPRSHDHERWKSSVFAEEINSLAGSASLKDTAADMANSSFV